jgi:S-adenosylmethionine decarboxylase
MATDSNLGLHILHSAETNETDLLCSVNDWMEFTRQELQRLGLICVGEVYHIFDSGGFTATFCLKESHICIHTWPEKSIYTYDVFLCNHTQNNESRTKDLAASNLRFFKADLISSNEIFR